MGHKHEYDMTQARKLNDSYTKMYCRYESSDKCIFKKNKENTDKITREVYVYNYPDDDWRKKGCLIWEGNCKCKRKWEEVALA